MRKIIPILIITMVLLIGSTFASAAAPAKNISKPIDVNTNIDSYGEVSLSWDTKEGTTYIVTRTDEEGNKITLAKTKLNEIKDIVRHKGTYTYSVLPVCGSMPVSVASIKKLKINGSNLDLMVSGRTVKITGKSTEDADGYVLKKSGKTKIIKKKEFILDEESDTIAKCKIKAYKKDPETGKKLYTDSITRYIYVSDYDKDKAIDYARKYALENNPEYRDYNPQGGDCANFVSQCLSYGGMKQTDDWNYLYGRGTSAWINVRSMYALFSKKYEVIEYPAYEDIEKGDILMKQDLSHVVICSDKDENGKPLICAHNDKHLDAPLYGDISGWIVIKPTSSKITVNYSAIELPSI